jgi:hypothetical protein
VGWVTGRVAGTIKPRTARWQRTTSKNVKAAITWGEAVCLWTTRGSVLYGVGLSPEAILGEFETLNLAQVYGAIAFYLENQAAIDA